MLNQATVLGMLDAVAAAIPAAACLIRFKRGQSIAAVCTGIDKTVTPAEQGIADSIAGTIRVARASIPAPWPTNELRVDVSTDSGVSWQTYRIMTRREFGGMVTITLGSVHQ